MNSFPGHSWSTAAVQDPSVGKSWWKWEAGKAWLDQHPRLRSIVRCDDPLGLGIRRARVRIQLERRGLHVLLTARRPPWGDEHH